MLKNVRYKIAYYFAKKALAQTESGEFEEMLKGLKNFKRSVMVMPPSKEMQKIGEELQEIVTRHSEKLGG